MSNAPYELVHRPGKVFETFGPRTEMSPPIPPEGAEGGYEDRHPVDEVSTALNYMVVDCHFVLPPLPADEPGNYPILRVSNGRPGDGSGVFLNFAYEPYKERFLVAANAGCRSPALQVLHLDHAPVSHFTGEVLHALVLIARAGIFPSITEAFTSHELFGELVLSDRFRRQPWGKPPEGTWWITSGAASGLDDEERCFPAGFGLSDLRVTVFDAWDEGFEKVHYSGALDHLASVEADPFGDDDEWDLGHEESMSELLQDLADELQVLSGGVSTWARRAESLAEETRHLGRQIAQDDEATTRELDRDLYT